MAQKLDSGKGTVEMILLSDIQFDPSYQRGLKRFHKKYARDWDAAAAGIPTVARRENGSLWGIDGKQRFEGAAKSGISRMRCFVVRSSGPQYEAVLFKKINKDRTGVTMPELLNAALTAQEPAALATQRAVEAAGLILPRHVGGQRDTRDSKDNVITCHGTVWKAADSYGEEKLTRALKLIVATWPNNRDALSNLMVGAVCMLVGTQGDILDDSKFVRTCGKKAVMKYLQDAALDIDSKAHGVLRALVTQYNKSRGLNKLRHRFREEAVEQESVTE